MNPSTPTTQNLATRPLNADDLRAVIALDRTLSGVDRHGFFETRLKAATENPKDYVYVALTSGGDLVGFAMAGLIEGAFGNRDCRAQLDAFGVAEAFQHLGGGRRLIDEIRAILAHKGIGALETQIAFRDRALLGFLGEVGFRLAPRLILGRSTEKLRIMPPEDDGESDGGEADYSAPATGTLEFDAITVRSMTEADLDAVIRIDAKLSGERRDAYFRRKNRQLTAESGVQVSLTAEIDGLPVGYIMARVDFGGFGRAMPEAEMDTLGVEPGFQDKGVGHAMMARLIDNLAGLRVETLRTEIAWDQTAMTGFLSGAGFAPAQRVSLVADV